MSLTAVPQNPEAQKNSCEPPGRLVDAGGFRLHIFCTGPVSRNPTVILLHGLGDNSLDWGLVQPEVARFTRVCSYDRAGAGWSDPGPAPRGPLTVAKELHSLLTNAKETGPYVLVGHPWA
jgi:pimeloyl-ACP methyl ester carboxylesterase